MTGVERNNHNVCKRSTGWKVGFALLAVLMLLPGIGHANTYSSQGEGTASATVIAGIKITQEADLRFGSFIPSENSQGDITISHDPTGNRNSHNPNIVLLESDYGSAKFRISGEPGHHYTVSLPTSVKLTGPGGAQMTIVNLQSSKPNGNIPHGSAEEIYVGGTLQVGANQQAGTYQGTYHITVAYN